MPDFLKSLWQKKRSHGSMFETIDSSRLTATLECQLLALDVPMFLAAAIVVKRVKNACSLLPWLKKKRCSRSTRWPPFVVAVSSWVTHHLDNGQVQAGL